MPEILEFVQVWFAEVEAAGIPGQLRQVEFLPGTRLLANVCPVAGEKGTAEAADLHLADGKIARQIPRSRFVVRQNQRVAA